MNVLTARLVYQYRAELGEGALWDERQGKLWWVDITSGHLHRFDPKIKTNETFEIGIPVGAVVPEEGGDVVLAVKNGFARYDTLSRTLLMLTTVEHENQSIRFNDGKCDSRGRFWAGTLAEDGTKNAGKLFCLEGDLSVSEKLPDVGISNGIGWSPRGERMYYIDSVTQKILEFLYDGETGSITNPRTVVEIETEEGTPDGMCVDREGMLWVALWDGGKVVRINPENGERLLEVQVPGVSKVTSCALGGDGQSTLFITTARQGLTPEEEEKQPNAGSLFAVDVDVEGLPTNLFRGK